MMPRDRVETLLKLLPSGLWLCLGLLAVFYAVRWFSLPSAERAASAPPAPLEWEKPTLPEPDDWRVFVGEESGASADGGALASRYRLAGTFFLTGPEWSEEELRKAVLDDLDRQRQLMVSEGEVFDGVEVVRVYVDRVTLRHSGREEDLWLSFAGRADAVAAVSGEAPERELRWDERVIESNRWGNRIGDHRWILHKDQLLRYYEDVMNDPERLANLFISMRPVIAREEGGDEITGYVLRPRGEGDFYEGVGLREGDIVRKVNSMRMVRQERAEYFIREFMEGRLDAVVMDVERDGKEEQLIYYLR